MAAEDNVNPGYKTRIDQVHTGPGPSSGVSPAAAVGWSEGELGQSPGQLGLSDPVQDRADLANSFTVSHEYPAYGDKARQNVGDSRSEHFNDSVGTSRAANGGLDNAANHGVTGSGESVV